MPGCFPESREGGVGSRNQRSRLRRGFLTLAIISVTAGPFAWSGGPPRKQASGNLVNLPSGAVSILAPRPSDLLEGGRRQAGQAGGGSSSSQAPRPSQASADTRTLLNSNRRSLLPPRHNGRVTGSAARIPYLRDYRFSTGNSYQDPGRNNNTPGAVRNGYIGQSGDPYGTSGNPLFVGPPGG